MKNRQKIIIDTNLWIHFLLSKKFSFLDKLLANRKVQLVFCEELLLELLETTSRTKLKKFFTDDEMKLIIDIIDRYSIDVTITSLVIACRDRKDNFLLSLAKDSEADYLITGDKDLLILKTFENTQIVTMSEYQMIMQL